MSRGPWPSSACWADSPTSQLQSRGRYKLMMASNVMTSLPHGHKSPSIAVAKISLHERACLATNRGRLWGSAKLAPPQRHVNRASKWRIVTSLASNKNLAEGTRLGAMREWYAHVPTSDLEMHGDKEAELADWTKVLEWLGPMSVPRRLVSTRAEEPDHALAGLAGRTLSALTDRLATRRGSRDAAGCFARCSRALLHPTLGGLVWNGMTHVVLEQKPEGNDAGSRW